MSKLTADQLRIVESRDKNIIVSAAAGSGKTKVLVDRIIDLVVADRVDIDTMIIVTFTNKASAEMKTRIQARLEEAYRNNPSDREFLKDQLRRLRSAHIQTLHSFCGDMLREYFNDLDDLSPNFKVIDERKARILKLDSVDELFDYHYENITDGFREFVNNFATGRDDKNAKEVVLFAYQKIMDQINPAKASEKYFSDFSATDDYRKLVLEELADYLAKMRELIDHPYTKEASEKLNSFLLEEYNSLNDIYLGHRDKDFDEDSWELFVDLLNNYKFKPIKSDKTIDKGEEYDYIKKTRLSRVNTPFKNFVASLEFSKKSVYDKYKQKELLILDELSVLIREFESIYEGKKNDAASLDFTDLEHRFLDLLEIDSVREEIRGRFNFIFFDEYQDANDVQNEIVERLKKDDNLFFVGDVKQSIYGFRRANPELFLEKLKTYETDPISERIDLNKNFRTEKDILTFNNYIFDRLMTIENAGIDYKNDNHSLNFVKNIDQSPNKVEIDIIDEDSSEYQAVANRILDLLNESYFVEETDEDDKKKIVEKKYDYKDITVLLRSGKAKAYKYEQELKLAGIPVKNEVDNTADELVEVEFFVNNLRLVANPYDDITLLAVIRSEVFGFDEEDIAKIKLFSNFNSFNEAFYDYYKQASTDRADDKKLSNKDFDFYDEDLANKVVSFISAFSQYRYELSMRNLYDFGNYIFEQTGYYTFLKARDRASERISNVEDTIDMMGAFDEANDNGLFGFLKYKDDLTKADSSNLMGRDLTENENFVRIMTVHKSKGLENKAIILANADRTITNQDGLKNYIFHPELGFGFKLIDRDYSIRVQSQKHMVIAKKIESEILREEIRILYVALTRAENKLVVSGRIKDFEKELDNISRVDDYMKLKSHMAWILKALSDDKLMEDYFDTSTTDELTGLVKINYLYDKEINEQNREGVESLIKEDYKGKILDEIRENFAPYRYEIATTDPLKKSVTEISKNYVRTDEEYEENDFRYTSKDFTFKVPSFLQTEDVFSPMDRGTIIHKVFQNIPIKSYTKEGFNKEVDNLINSHKLTKAEAKLVEVDKFLAFYNNDLIIDLANRASNIITEESFLMKYKNPAIVDDYYYINGQIDLMFEFADEIVFLDFKTDQTKREEAYRGQLAYYKEAIEKAKKKKVSQALIYWYNFNEFSSF